MHALIASFLALSAACGALLLSKAAAFAAGCWRARKQFVSSPIPGPQPTSKLIGHVPQILGPKNAWVFTQWANTQGPLFKLHILNHFMLVLTDVASIMQLTRRGGHVPYMPKARVVYQALEVAVKPRTRNIVTTEDGDYWRAVRQGTAPCFSLSNLKKVVPLLVDLSQRVAKHMALQQQQQQQLSSLLSAGGVRGSSSGALVDLSDAARRITSDVMGEMLLGEDLGGTRWEDTSPYLDIFYHVLKAQAVLVTNPLYLWQLWRADARHARWYFSRHNAMMDDKVAALLKQPPPDYTIAAHLLRVVDPATGQRLTAQQLKAEVAAFMAAGHETTSHAITWCLATLAVHPEVQEEVFEELATAGLAATATSAGSATTTTPPRPFAASDFGRLPLLSAVIKEGLRLLPPTPLGGVRICMDDDVQLCGYRVPKGTLINIPSLPLALAYHTFGPDAMLFRPHSWLNTEASAANNNSSSSSGGSGGDDNGGNNNESSVPRTHSTSTAGSSSSTAAPSAATGLQPDPLTFGTGVRDCLGQNLAKLELHVVLATLLSRFRFSPGPQLQQEVKVVAATGAPPIAAVYALAEVHVTLQPAGGSLWLVAEQR